MTWRCANRLCLGIPRSFGPLRVICLLFGRPLPAAFSTLACAVSLSFYPEIALFMPPLFSSLFTARKSLPDPRPVLVASCPNCLLASGLGHEAALLGRGEAHHHAHHGNQVRLRTTKLTNGVSLTLLDKTWQGERRRTDPHLRLLPAKRQQSHPTSKRNSQQPAHTTPTSTPATPPNSQKLQQQVPQVLEIDRLLARLGRVGPCPSRHQAQRRPA